jgi:hypothetical protein
MRRLTDMTNLRRIAYTAIASGLLVAFSGHWWGVSLVVAGGLGLPLERRIKRLATSLPLDEQRLRALSNDALDVLEVFLCYSEGEVNLGTVIAAAHAAGDDRLPDTKTHYDSVQEIVACGLIDRVEYHQSGYMWVTYAAVSGAAETLREEQERRIRVPKPGRRSRLSSLASRLA